MSWSTRWTVMWGVLVVSLGGGLILGFHPVSTPSLVAGVPGLATSCGAPFDPDMTGLTALGVTQCQAVQIPLAILATGWLVVGLLSMLTMVVVGAITGPAPAVPVAPQAPQAP